MYAVPQYRRVAPEISKFHFHLQREKMHFSLCGSFLLYPSVRSFSDLHGATNIFLRVAVGKTILVWACRTRQNV